MAGSKSMSKDEIFSRLRNIAQCPPEAIFALDSQAMLSIIVKFIIQNEITRFSVLNQTMINMAIPRSGSFSKHMQNASENPFVAQIIRQNINMMMKKDNLVLDNNTPLEQVIEILFKIMEKQPSIDQRDKSSTDQLKINNNECGILQTIRLEREEKVKRKKLKEEEIKKTQSKRNEYEERNRNLIEREERFAEEMEGKGIQMEETDTKISEQLRTKEINLRNKDSIIKEICEAQALIVTDHENIIQEAEYEETQLAEKEEYLSNKLIVLKGIKEQKLIIDIPKERTDNLLLAFELNNNSCTIVLNESNEKEELSRGNTDKRKGIKERKERIQTDAINREMNDKLTLSTGSEHDKVVERNRNGKGTMTREEMDKGKDREAKKEAKLDYEQRLDRRNNYLGSQREQIEQEYRILLDGSNNLKKEFEIYLDMRNRMLKLDNPKNLS